jgi:hypothetical protein
VSVFPRKKENMLAAALLPLLVCVLVLTVAAYAMVMEKQETLTDQGPLQAYCAQLREQSRDDARRLQTLLDLELVERNVVVWRLDWVCAVAIGLVAGAGVCCSGGGCRQAAAVFILAYLTSMLALRLHRSYHSAHIAKHPSDTRMRLIKEMLGLKDTSSHYFGIPPQAAVNSQSSAEA